MPLLETRAEKRFKNIYIILTIAAKKSWERILAATLAATLASTQKKVCNYNHGEHTSVFC